MTTYIQYAIKNVKWTAFWKALNIDDDIVALKDINKLRGAMEKKEADECKARHKNCSKTVLKLRQQYNEFIQTKKKVRSLPVLGGFPWYNEEVENVNSF